MSQILIKSRRKDNLPSQIIILPETVFTFYLRFRINYIKGLLNALTEIILPQYIAMCRLFGKWASEESANAH